MTCNIIDLAISFFKESCKEKNEEIKTYQASQDDAFARDEWELIAEIDFILVNLRFELHSRLKALEVLESYKENFECDDVD